jgi:hypothetical protein
MKTIKWFAAGMAGMFVGGLLMLQLAASGDLIYEDTVSVEIAGSQAAAIADAFIAAGAWDGNRDDMRECQVLRTATNEFNAMCRGAKSAPPGSLPKKPGGVNVIGIVE